MEELEAIIFQNSDIGIIEMVGVHRKGIGLGNTMKDNDKEMTET